MVVGPNPHGPAWIDNFDSTAPILPAHPGKSGSKAAGTAPQGFACPALPNSETQPIFNFHLHPQLTDSLWE